MRLAAQQGLYGIMVQSYGPQIRGGESAVILRFSEEEVQVESDEADLLLCFRTRDLQRFRGSVRLHAASVMVLEANDDGVPPDWLGASDLPPYRYPFARFENGVEIEGEPKNMMGLGARVPRARVDLRSGAPRARAALRSSPRDGGAQSRHLRPRVGGGARDADARAAPWARHRIGHRSPATRRRRAARWPRACASSPGIPSRRRPRSSRRSSTSCRTWAAPWCRPRTRSRPSAWCWARASAACRR